MLEASIALYCSVWDSLEYVVLWKGDKSWPNGIVTFISSWPNGIVTYISQEAAAIVNMVWKHS